jgi:hypothetical protein
MPNNIRQFLDLIPGGIQGFLYGIAITTIPSVLIEHEHHRFFLFLSKVPWQQQFSQACLIGSPTVFFAIRLSQKKVTENLSSQPVAVADVAGSGFLTAIFKWLKAHAFALVTNLFFLLFIACAQLCQKLHVGVLPSSILSQENWMSLGCCIVTLAAVIMVRTLTIAHTNQLEIASPKRFRITNSLYAAGLVYLAGLSLSFATWIPLLAIPGAVVLIHWRAEALARHHE